MVILHIHRGFTAGASHFTDDGREIKKFNVNHSIGITLLLKNNIEVAVITGRTSVIVADRMRSLGVNHVYQGRMNKLETYENLKAALQIADHEVAFVGDDVIDIPIMTQCGLSVAVADAHHLVLEQANWVLTKNGGDAAARIVCDVLLESQNGVIDYSFKPNQQ